MKLALNRMGVRSSELFIFNNFVIKMAANQPRVPKGSSAGGQFGAMSGSGAKQTDTAQFKEWFGNSKVVDENGDPLVMYHGGGSNEGFAHEFIGAGNALGPGFYFTSDPVTANMYADRQNVGGAVKPVFISVQNPMIVDTSSVTPKRLPISTIESLVTNSPRANPPTQQSASQQAHTAQTVKAAIAEYSNISELDAFFKIGNEFYGQGFNDTSNHFKSYLTNFTALTGYDGVIRRGPVIMSRVIVSAFQPQQIKSAIGNSGAFNANSPDITKMAAN